MLPHHCRWIQDKRETRWMSCPRTALLSWTSLHHTNKHRLFLLPFWPRHSLAISGTKKTKFNNLITQANRSIWWLYDFITLSPSKEVASYPLGTLEGDTRVQYVSSKETELLRVFWFVEKKPFSLEEADQMQSAESFHLSWSLRRERKGREKKKKHRLLPKGHVVSWVPVRSLGPGPDPKYGDHWLGGLIR